MFPPPKAQIKLCQEIMDTIWGEGKKLRRVCVRNADYEQQLRRFVFGL